MERPDTPLPTRYLEAEKTKSEVSSEVLDRVSDMPEIESSSEIIDRHSEMMPTPRKSTEQEPSE